MVGNREFVLSVLQRLIYINIWPLIVHASCLRCRCQPASSSLLCCQLLVQVSGITSGRLPFQLSPILEQPFFSLPLEIRNSIFNSMLTKEEVRQDQHTNLSGVALPAEANFGPATTRISPSIPSASQRPCSSRPIITKHGASPPSTATRDTQPNLLLCHRGICRPHIGCCDKNLSQHLNANLNYFLICKQITAEAIPLSSKPKLKAGDSHVYINRPSTISMSPCNAKRPFSFQLEAQRATIRVHLRAR
jgi:hypothetical protein